MNKYFRVLKQKNKYLIISPYKEKMLKLLSSLHFRFPEKNLIYSDKHYGYILSVWAHSMPRRLKLISLIEKQK